MTRLVPATDLAGAGRTNTIRKKRPWTTFGTIAALFLGANSHLFGQITMPIEVMGNPGTIRSVSVTVPAGSNLSGSITLTAQIHGLEYETQASVSVNGQAWIALTSNSLTGLAGQYGGLGGGYSTVNMNITLPAGAIHSGSNSVAFRFNATDGNSSGFRVLAFNFQTSNGTQLLSGSNFVQENPATWAPPLNDSNDIAAGQNLWRSAGLVQRNSSNGTYGITAHCGDCHSQDGRDLKYFNYSNNAIYNRAIFHGLNSTQANQIASYIRSLSTPAPSQARPWNPPYQPGAGLDSEPVSSWSAGAGLASVLKSDAALEPYLAPGNSTSGWAASKYLNTRELPIPVQLPDWNHWLPRIHPKDAWGGGFTGNPYYQIYTQLPGQLSPNNTGDYSAALGNFSNWFVAQDNFVVSILLSNPNWNANNLRTDMYSLAQWGLVKQWELNQEYGLEGMTQAPFGSKGEARAWFGNRPFHTSPNMLKIPAGSGLGNGSVTTQLYLSYIWYHVQLVLNDGNGSEHGQDPIDYPYVFGYTKALSQYGNNAPEAMLQLMWLVKALQTETDAGVGPQQGSDGWQPIYADPSSLVNSAWWSIWSATDPSTRASLSQSFLQAWFPQISSYSPQQFYAGGWANPNDNPQQLDGNANFGGIVWYMLPRFRYYGVSAGFTDQIADWAATIWPRGNWGLNKAASCNAQLQCTSD